ncbi:hypothetical protein [Paenibacillus hamazuiensis]|uniref:hypothetical protein n=1 Tax=Paenibacillus hamazuiensis TaxID=2936508 RepID=UPI002010471A|nr:hypothetical protein [Paenibacillus hamazuiensis]
MPLYTYYLIFFLIMLFGAVATLMIGHSKKNKEGNPNYDKQTKSIFRGLSLYYIIAIGLGFLALVVYIIAIS